MKVQKTHNTYYNNICKCMFRNTSYTKVNTKYLWILTLTTQYSIYIKIQLFFNGISKGFVTIAKDKGGRHLFLRLTRCRNGCELLESEKIE